MNNVRNASASGCIVARTGWVRDNFLDFVEYANGDADSEWGILRAAAGHTNPFDLNYVEIGNENQSVEFGKRYRFIHDALKARYPDIKYLADLSFTSRESMGGAEFDIEDRHYYSSPQWFASGFNRYDGWDRGVSWVSGGNERQFVTLAWQSAGGSFRGY